MMHLRRIGLIRETKTPPDRRVALTPDQALAVKEQFPDIDLVVQSSNIRCFPDQAYRDAGVEVREDLSDRDLLIGIKEVNVQELLSEKHYLFFAHVAKKQAYNRFLLKEIIRKKITLMDYEYLTDEQGNRLIAFGRWAGIVGAYNGLRAWGLRTGSFQLKPAHQCLDREEMNAQLKGLNPGAIRILVTGGGRVGHGAMETLSLTGFKIVTPEEYLFSDADEPLICRIDPWDYAARKDGRPFELHHFFTHPKEYYSTFQPFYTKTDLLIAGHYWDPDSPRLWELSEMSRADFRIRAIADISCDIRGSVPCTIKATKIAEPFYGFDRFRQTETAPFGLPEAITMMTIDNLPGELPRDASGAFGEILMKEILPRLLQGDQNEVINRATIVRNGRLTGRFSYLEEFVQEGADD